MKTATLSAAELATQIVGDGKKPNKYFVTIGYGWYRPKMTEADGNELPEMVQAPNSLESVTLGPFNSRGQALNTFNSIELNTAIEKVTGETISQVIIEDRLSGTVREKCLAERRSHGFCVDTWD